MRDENGKTPLGWLVTIIIVLLIAGVTIAMIFGDNEEFSNMVKQYQNKNTNNTVQTQTK